MRNLSAMFISVCCMTFMALDGFSQAENAESIIEASGVKGGLIVCIRLSISRLSPPKKHLITDIKMFMFITI